MIFEIFSIFPEIFDSYLKFSIVQRAIAKELINVRLHNIRDWATDKHRMTDDEPYGGGGGMVMKPEPIFAAVENVVGAPPVCPVILLTPQGRTFNQEVAHELAEKDRLALICGRYEGVDERVRLGLASDEISIGDFVLSGGELPALVLIDAITRLIPSALGDPEAAKKDSHASGLLEHPHYTRPAIFREWAVPEVLLSGDHGKIARWRRLQSLHRTWLRRPELLANVPLAEEEKLLLKELNRQDLDKSMK